MKNETNLTYNKLRTLMIEVDYAIEDGRLEHSEVENMPLLDLIEWLEKQEYDPY